VGEIHVVALAGELDMVSAEQLAPVLTDLLAARCAVVVDLAELALLDAAGIATVVSAYRTAQERGVELRVVGARGLVLGLMEMTGVAGCLGARQDLAAALADIQGGSAGEAHAQGGLVGEAHAQGGLVGEAHAQGGSGQSSPVDEASSPDGDRIGDAAVSAGSETGIEAVAGLLERADRLPLSDPLRRTLRDRAVAQALPYARRLASRYLNRGEPAEDLFQVAALGMVKAVHGYDPARGAGFLAYAVPTVLGELRRYFRDNGWGVSVPRRLQELRLEVNQATEALTQRLHRRPTAAEIADFLGVAEREVSQALVAARGYRPASLFRPAGGEGDEELAEVIGVPDAALDHVDNWCSVEPMIARLPQREQRVLAMRFFGNMTQSQIAEQLGLSQMHVSRLLAGATAKLRAGLLDADRAAPDQVRGRHSVRPVARRR
jgi:RNA polymerase sigma-B factor